MPSKYPVCKPQEVIAAFKKKGYTFISQKGSHAKYGNGEHVYIIPMHEGDLKKWTLKSILEQTETSLDEFNRLR